MSVVVITRPLPEEGLKELAASLEVHVLSVHTLDEDLLIEAARDASAIVSVLSDPLTERVFEACPTLKVVAQYAVGHDNIDLAAARRNGVVVTHTPGVLTDATADLAFALLLAVGRRLLEADAYVREGRFKRWETMLLLGTELRGKTLGIIGMGRIGLAVARRAVGFGMNVIYHNRSRANLTFERRVDARYVGMDELLRESDIVSLHCPLNRQSRNLIDAGALEQMKSTALLINTARGPIVDESALVEALRGGGIAGAGLDVYEQEPLVHEGLLDLDNVVLAPHLGSATTETRTEMARMCAESILAVLSGAESIPYRIA